MVYICNHPTEQKEDTPPPSVPMDTTSASGTGEVL